jgi:3-deoxy-D-manno-octulosonate 8-phosphate phosphatase KdsC-like HAD superfamily phosphatase
VGLRVAVADAAPELRARADWITSTAGGEGALREVVEAVLRAQERWEALVRDLFDAPAGAGGP